MSGLPYGAIVDVLTKEIVPNNDAKPGMSAFTERSTAIRVLATLLVGGYMIGRYTEAFAYITEQSRTVDPSTLASCLVTRYAACSVTGTRGCISRDCELHYMDAPLRLAPPE